MKYELHQLDLRSLDTKRQKVANHFAFIPLKVAIQFGGPKMDLYRLAYEGNAEDPDERGGINRTLEYLYEKFNIDFPENFKGHSMSVSDIIKFDINGKISWWYCDVFGFAEISNILKPAKVSVREELQGIIDELGNMHYSRLEIAQDLQKVLKRLEEK